MARNIIICCDGTNHQFGTENANVVRLIQCLDRTPGLQRLYYDPEVGTLPEPGWITGVGKWLSKTVQLAVGVGLTTNVTEAGNCCPLPNLPASGKGPDRGKLGRSSRGRGRGGWWR